MKKRPIKLIVLAAFNIGIGKSAAPANAFVQYNSNGQL